MPKQGRNRGQITATGNTALAAGNIALGAGWGGTTVAITSGANDVAGQLVLTCATGGGLAQATATITITFATAYSATPRAVLISCSNDNSIDTGHTSYTVSTTALVITFLVLPVNTKIYTFDYLVVA